jgi:hypothetical protein
MNVFEGFRAEAYPYRFRVGLLIRNIAGGIPSSPSVIEKWIRSKVESNDETIRKLIAETMVERGVDLETAMLEVAAETSVNGFKASEEHGLYIEGRQVKAMLKEAASIAANEGKLSTERWGNPDKNQSYRKGLKGWFPEHVFVEEDVIPLGVREPTETVTGFLHVMTAQGPRNAISRFDYVEEVKVSLHVVSDHDFSERDWAMIWLTGGENGLGANRSQGYGRFDVIEWEPEPR